MGLRERVSAAVPALRALAWRLGVATFAGTSRRSAGQAEVNDGGMGSRTFSAAKLTTVETHWSERRLEKLLG